MATGRINYPVVCEFNIRLVILLGEDGWDIGDIDMSLPVQEVPALLDATEGNTY